MFVRKSLGVVCVLIGAVPPYFFYVHSESKGIWQPVVLGIVLLASLISFLIFSVCQKRIANPKKRMVTGALWSYAGFLIFILVESVLTKSFSETLMWSPIIVLVGVPYTASVVAMSYLGSVLFWNRASNQ